MASAGKLPPADEVIESGLVQDFDASLSGIGQKLDAGASSSADVRASPGLKKEESRQPPEEEQEQEQEQEGEGGEEEEEEEEEKKMEKEESENDEDEDEKKSLPSQYVLCAAPCPAADLQDETLTYLEHGQSYEIRILGNRKPGELEESAGKLVKSLFRVVLPGGESEQQQLYDWRTSRPGERILDLDILACVGLREPRANPSLVNTVEFLWDPAQRTSVFFQVRCLSTEFALSKAGGEEGEPFRIQIDTFEEDENGEYTEHLHSVGCQIQVFEPKDAEGQEKADSDQMEQPSPDEKENSPPCGETTVLIECAPWPEISVVSDSPELDFTSSQSSFSIGEESVSPTPQPEPPVLLVDNLLPTMTAQEAEEWLHRNRFSTFSQLFPNCSGADLLKLTRDEVIQICGPADGIRLFNAIKGRMVTPRLTIYLGQESLHLKEPEDEEEEEELSQQEGQEQHENGYSNGTLFAYQAVSLEELTAVELTEKIAQLCSISPCQITQIYKQGPTGIHVLISDEMIQNFEEEACFVLDTMKAERSKGYHIILK